MHKELIIKAFKKAEEERVKSGDKKPSLVNISEDISDFIYEIEGFRLGERSFRDYRKDVLKLKNNNEDININQIKVVQGLYKYLGFNSYEDFASSLNSNGNNENDLRITQKLPELFNKYWIIVVSAIFLIAVLIINSINHQKWMVWDEDHYIEVKFDTEKYDIGELKLYKKDRIDNFKKIITDCNTTFYNENGSVMVWYGKNLRGELEYFNSLGLHPNTSKTLKPITTYIINKYICNSN